MNLKLEIILNKDINQENLKKIIEIKQMSWQYTFEEHATWIHENLRPFDKHIILIQNKVASAYLNLIDIIVIIDGKEYKAMGIGNLCATQRGSGNGAFLLNWVNELIINDNVIGLLFCKKDLLKFYSFNGWKMIDTQRIIVNSSVINFYAMIYNHSLSFNLLEYNGNLF
jgi:hypothetical protein